MVLSWSKYFIYSSCWATLYDKSKTSNYYRTLQFHISDGSKSTQSSTNSRTSI